MAWTVEGRARAHLDASRELPHFARMGTPDVVDQSSTLNVECARWIRQLGPEGAASKWGLTSEDVLRAHFHLAVYFGAMGEGIGGVGPRSLHLLQSAVSRQYVSLDGVLKWDDLFDTSATLFFGLIKNHPFHDANKRTALLSALYQLQCHNRVVTVPQSEFEELTVRVAEGGLSKYGAFRDLRGDDTEVRFISRYLRRHTRALDKRDFHVSFRQFNGILNRYGFALSDPLDNRIHVVETIEERYGFLNLKTRRVQRVISTIGFHDWGTEVSQKDIREVRRVTKLTTDRGFDTAVLMQDLDPMESLIAAYAGPLRRLAKK